MNKKPIEQKIQRAETLLEQDEAQEANQILLEALKSSKYDKKLSQEILFLCIEREMYDEALQLFHDYKTATGQDLPSDFAVQDVKNWAIEKAKKTSAYAEQYVKVFKKRTSLKSNLFCFIREVRISDDYIEFAYRNRTDRHMWSTLSDAYITKKETPRNPYSDTKDHIVFVFGRRKYKLRTDPVFEDLEDTNIFLKEVRKHCTLRTRKAKGNILWLVLVVCVSLVLLYLLIKSH